MNKIICATAAFVYANAVAHAPEAVPGPAKGSADRMLVIGANQMPLLPPAAELRKMQNMSTIKADDGFSPVDDDPERVRQFMNDLETVKSHQSSAAEATAFAEALTSGKAIATAPVTVANLNDLKLGFSAAAVRSGRLIGASPQGTLVNGAWTGVERYFRIEGSGYSRVSETDMAASGGMFYMNKGAVNTTVAGKPAISIVFRGEQGRTVEEVLWVNGGKLYKVTYAPDLQAGRNGMMKANSAVSATSLATELR